MSSIGDENACNSALMIGKETGTHWKQGHLENLKTAGSFANVKSPGVKISHGFVPTTCLVAKEQKQYAGSTIRANVSGPRRAALCESGSKKKRKSNATDLTFETPEAVGSPDKRRRTSGRSRQSALVADSVGKKINNNKAPLFSKNVASLKRDPRKTAKTRKGNAHNTLHFSQGRKAAQSLQSIFGSNSENVNNDNSADRDAIEQKGHRLKKTLSMGGVHKVRNSANQGEGSSSSKPKTKQADAILDMLEAGNFSVIRKMIDLLDDGDSKEFCKAVVHAMSSTRCSALVGLIQQLAVVEIKETKDPGTLFRGVSPTTRLCSSFMQHHALDYGEHIILPILEEIDSDHGARVEVNPSRIPTDHLSEEEKEAELQNVLQPSRLFVERWTKELLGSVISIPGQMPPAVRALMMAIEESVKPVFPDMICRTIGGIIFLRWLNPLVVQPKQLPSLEDLGHPKCRRALLLISKIIQNISNEIPFGEKEDYMLPFNKLIHEFIPKLHSFFEALTAGDMSALLGNLNSSQPSKADIALSNQALCRLVSLIKANTEKLVELLCGHEAKSVQQLVDTFDTKALSGKKTSVQRILGSSVPSPRKRLRGKRRGSQDIARVVPPLHLGNLGKMSSGGTLRKKHRAQASESDSSSGSNIRTSSALKLHAINSHLKNHVSKLPGSPRSRTPRDE